MKRSLQILSFFILVPPGLLFSQDTPGKFILDVSILAARNAASGLTYNEIQGSPYYSDAFVNSVVHLKNGDSASIPLRYDLYQDQIEFRREEKILWLTKTDISYIQYGKEILYPEPLYEHPDKLTYYFVPEKGKYALYIRKKVCFQARVPAQAYTEPVPDRFERDPDEYYLKQEGMPAGKIRSKKALSEMLAGNEPALDFIKQNKIKTSDPEDLLKLVQFLNNQYSGKGD